MGQGCASRCAADRTHEADLVGLASLSLADPQEPLIDTLGCRGVSEAQKRVVTLHIYDNGSQRVQAINKVLHPLSMGIFHCGVEIYGWEWSFSAEPAQERTSSDSSGVFCSYPTRCRGFNYLESVILGSTAVSEGRWYEVLQDLERRWPSVGYHVLRHNCYHFCAELTRLLGVKGLPAWVTALADTARAVAEQVDHPLSGLHCGRGPGCCGERRRCCRHDAGEVTRDPGDGLSYADNLRDEMVSDTLAGVRLAKPGRMHLSKPGRMQL